MGRLTEHMDYCFLACYEQQGDKIREECPIYKCCYSRQMHEKLSHYEDLEEQGYKMVNTDKVVEQLLKNAYKVTEKNTNLEHAVIGLIDAIKIVKGGGTDE